MTKQPLADRFWPKVKKANGCWEWKAAKDDKGYGVIQIDGKARGAHRIAYELAYGVSLGTLFACHTCDNPGCVRPDHLFAGTAADNATDRKRKGHALPGHNRGGYKLSGGTNAGERNPRHKLTQQQIDDIRARWQPRVVTHAMLAIEYSVSEHTIRKITSGRTWNLDGRYVGSRETYTEAQNELDALVFAMLTGGA